MVQTKEFILSAKTGLFITSKAKTNNRLYSALRRIKEVNGPQRYFYMSLQKLSAVLNIITNIQILLRRDTDKEQGLTVDDYLSISVSTFRGKKYVGFLKTGKKSQRMNIDIEEFNIDIEEFNIGIEEFNIDIEEFNIDIEEFNIDIEEFNIDTEEFNIDIEELNIDIHWHRRI